MMNLEYWALGIGILGVFIAIGAFIHSARVTRWTKRSIEETERRTEERMSFLIHLIVNSASDPDTVRRMLEDYGRAGEWRAKVSRRPDGKYGLDFAI